MGEALVKISRTIRALASVSAVSGVSPSVRDTEVAGSDRDQIAESFTPIQYELRYSVAAGGLAPEKSK